MPLRMPTSRPWCRRSSPSRLQPASGVWISLAYVGDTVVMESENVNPALRKFTVS